jgi:hypothetical protein
MTSGEERGEKIGMVNEMKDTMRPPPNDKPPRNRDQTLPPRKGDTLERAFPEKEGRKDDSRKAHQHDEAETYDRESRNLEQQPSGQP